MRTQKCIVVHVMYKKQHPETYGIKRLEHVCNSGMLMLMTTTSEIWLTTDL